MIEPKDKNTCVGDFVTHWRSPGGLWRLLPRGALVSLQGAVAGKTGISTFGCSMSEGTCVGTNVGLISEYLH